jgi:hypothetical protein
MGMFKNMKDAVGQAGPMPAAGAMAGALQDRDALQGQAHEQNRILRIGSPGSATIKGHVDAGEVVAGNPVWILEIDVVPEGGSAYTVQKREIISSVAMSGYGDGITMPCRIDPADANTIAFGDKPFM